MFTSLPITLVGLAGGAGVGKDTLADRYMRQSGFLPLALADEIKVRVIASGRATFEEVYVTKPSHIRQLLQEEGTERGRDVYGEDYWFNCMMAKLAVLSARWGSGVTKIVVPDVRFPNEVELIQRAGGKVIKVDAPVRYAMNGLIGGTTKHRSEIALENFTAYDGVVQNDPEHEGTVGLELGIVLVKLGVIGKATGHVRFGQ